MSSTRPTILSTLGIARPHEQRASGPRTARSPSLYLINGITRLRNDVTTTWPTCPGATGVSFSSSISLIPYSGFWWRFPHSQSHQKQLGSVDAYWLYTRVLNACAISSRASVESVSALTIIACTQG